MAATAAQLSAATDLASDDYDGDDGDASAAASTAIVLAQRGGSSARLSIATLGAEMRLPALVEEAGEKAEDATFEYFTARIPNAHTRAAYGRAVRDFCAWCTAGGLRLERVTPPAIARYLEDLGRTRSLASIKLAASAIRTWLGFLTERGVLSVNPATSVRTPRLVVREGKTPALERAQARELFASLDAAAALGELLAQRDRALFSVMLFGFVRVGAVVQMTPRDFEDGESAWLRLHEKGGRERRIPCHHRTRDCLRAYLLAAGMKGDSRAPLFQSAPRKARAAPLKTLALSGQALSRGDVLRIVKRRCKPLGLPPAICNHSFRATGITLHQEGGGELAEAQKIAGHADPRTTQLYSRKGDKLLRSEIERVQL